MFAKNRMIPLFTVGAVLLTPSFAHAHAHLHSSEPAKGAVISIIPGELILHFTEALEAPLCKIELKNAASGEVVPLSKADFLSNDPKSLQVQLGEKTLKESAYKVIWKVVSKDGHKMQGDYQFTFKSKIGKK